MAIFGLGRCHHVDTTKTHVTFKQISDFCKELKDLRNMPNSSPLQRAKIREVIHGNKDVRPNIPGLRARLAEATINVKSDNSHNSKKHPMLKDMGIKLNSFIIKGNFQDSRSQPDAKSVVDLKKIGDIRVASRANDENNGAYR